MEKNEIKTSDGASKKSKILLAVFFLAIAAAVGVTFVRYFVLKDYYIQAETECDPALERCFVYECTPEEDGEDCPADETERTSYYKLIKKKAYAIPLCDPDDETCPALSCAPGEDCEETLCEEDNEEEGIVCNDPAEYAEEQNELGDEEAEGEDAEECAEDDAECLEGESVSEEEAENCEEGECGVEKAESAETSE